MSDSPDLIVALLAVMGLGAIAVPCSTIVNGDELAYMISDPQPRCVIVSTDQLANFTAAKPMLSSVPTILTMGPDAPSDWTDLSAAADAAPPSEPVALDPEAVAVILYTSGTTGHPKGAVHRHRDLPYVVEASGRGMFKIGPDDCIFSTARMFFSYGFSNSLSFPLAFGARCVLSNARPTPQLIADVLSRHHPTVLFGVPAIYRGLLEHHRAGHALDTHALRLCVTGGEKLAPQLFRDWKALTGTDLLDMIGTTEVMYGFIGTRPGRARPGSSGEPIPGYDVKLVDDAGATIATAGTGNLLVRGASIASHYWNKPGKAVLQDGWLRTGDIYRRDAEGYYFFEGRSDDLFKSSGLWVAPTEVEDALCGHPAVLEAAVVSLPDRDGGFASVAHVALRAGWARNDATAAAIAAHAAGVLPRHKRPRTVRFVDALPRTATGKIQRVKLREAFALEST